MSLFGPIDDGDRRVWQQRGLMALTQLVGMAVQETLPPLNWHLTSNGSLTGTVPTLASKHVPRTVFATWTAALDKHNRTEPRRPRLQGQASPARSAQTTSDGQVRLFAGYTFRLSTRPNPSIDFALIAQWWEDEVSAP